MKINLFFCLKITNLEKKKTGKFKRAHPTYSFKKWSIGGVLIYKKILKKKFKAQD